MKNKKDYFIDNVLIKRVQFSNNKAYFYSSERFLFSKSFDFTVTDEIFYDTLKDFDGDEYDIYLNKLRKYFNGNSIDYKRIYKSFEAGGLTI